MTQPLMDVEVFLTPYTVTEDDVRGKTAVVIDVFRACTTIAAALDAGARAVVPVADMEEAGKMASNLDQRSYLLGGERDGVTIDGYDVGNSPLEYLPERVEGRTIILTTTNGTRALARATAAADLVVGAFVNAGRVAEFVRRQERDAVIVCAGRRNRASLEDILCAGLLLSRIWEGATPDRMPDGTYVAHTTYARAEADLSSVLAHTASARRLRELGEEEDVAYCARLDAIPVLPYYSERRLVLSSRRRTAQSAS